MNNENQNTLLMVMGVVLILIIIAYFIYPIYFEKYILMNIPEYRRLSDVLDESKKSLEESKTNIAKHKKELDTLAKLGGTEAEILKRERKKVELEKRIESNKRELKQFTGLVANLKNQLKESTNDAEECLKLQASATKRMKELNDMIIKEFDLDDKSLARRLQATRDSLLALLETSKDVVCLNKDMALAMLSDSADMMRESSELNTICDLNTIKNNIRSEVFNEKTCKKFVNRESSYGTRWTECGEYEMTSRDFGPLHSRLVKVFDDIESTISYVLQNKFCSKDLVFSVDKFEKFMSDFINGLCESDDWKKVTGKHLDYILNKPASYL